MKVQRIVANISTGDPGLADKFYREILGLELLMDMNWIRTYGSKTPMSIQLSFMSEGGSGTLGSAEQSIPKSDPALRNDQPLSRKTFASLLNSAKSALPEPLAPLEIFSLQSFSA